MTTIPGNRQLSQELREGEEERRDGQPLDYRPPTGKWVKEPGKDWVWIPFEVQEKRS